MNLVIFDCDGVLIDSEGLACRIDAEELTRLGFTISVDEVSRRFTGIPANDMRAAIEAQWGRSLPVDYEHAVARRIETAFRNELRAVDGAADVLERLHVPFCVASSSAPGRLRLGLEVTGLLTFFEPHLFSASMVGRGKPAPDLFLLAAERMGAVPAQHVLVVEDSVAGVRAAVAAGMPVVGFLGGGHCGPEHASTLRSAGADMLVRSHAELAELVTARAAV